MTNTNDRLERAIGKMNKMSITDLRQVARELGISRPAVGKKERLITEIVALAKGEINPVPLSTRGAPPKSSNFDRELYTEIMELRQTSLSGKSDAMTFCDDNANPNSSGVYCGILIMFGKSSFLKDLSSGNLIAVHEFVVNKFNLRIGDMVKADCVINDNNRLEVTGVISVNGEAFGKTGSRRNFADMVRVYADTPLKTSVNGSCIALRMTDFFAPLALGQRVLALTDNRIDSTYVAGNLISELTKNADLEVVGAFIGCTPEDRVCLSRSQKNKLFFADFDEELSQKLETLCIAAEHCKRLVESGKDAVLVVDGFFRPAKSFNEVIREASGTLKKILACAGKMEEGGSLTIIAISDNSPVNNADRVLISEFADFENAFLKYARIKDGIILDYRVSRSDFAGEYAEAAGNLKLKLSDEVAAIFRENDDSCAIAQLYKD